MKKSFTVFMISSVLLGISAAASAAPSDWDRDHPPRPVPPHAAPSKWSNDHRPHERYRPVDIRRGDRLPPEFRHHRYHVDNWRAHRLHTPPRGYHWIKAGGRYMLISDHNYRVYSVR